MKKHVFFALATVVCFAVSASAQTKKVKRKALADEITGQGYGTSGCGLGSIVFGDKRGMIQVLAATTNGFMGTQSFGITSGTSNCVPEDGMESAASAFIETNRIALETDISRGNGENLKTYAKIVGCSDELNLGKQLQSKHSEIFNNPNKTSVELRNSIRRAIKQDQALAKSCSHLG